jgi:hypothetical protein
VKTLHLRADDGVINKIIDMVNQFSHEGREIEILDNITFDTEKKMILKGLLEEKENKVESHENVWNDLLN